ncbi:MAG: alkaline phosphatase family protein [Anaerolineales bacterium]|nr:alkaline phosphatase family protein [Anaerolineales bacterium]
MKKVITIGLDGFEPKIAEVMIARGELPNLKKLQDQGGYSRLGTTYSAQTPVAWSTFSTGTNPGGHGIFDFLSRDPNTYLPVMALSRYEQKNAFVLPKVVNMRRGTPFWDLLSERDIQSTILRVPCAYPPDQVKGRMLSGVGVPDLRGGFGTPTFYSSRTDIQADQAEKVVTISVEKDRLTTHVIGPRDPKSKSDHKFDINIQIVKDENKIIITSQGQPEKLEVRLGKWSKWLKVKFKVGMMQYVSGIVRFNLRQLEPDFELYASPVNFETAEPLFPISSPKEYAHELAMKVGRYYTAGMAEDHDGLNLERFDEAAYLDQCRIVMRERRRMMEFELGRFESGYFFCLFDTPDRLAHMFWRFREPEHPSNHGEHNPEFANVIEEHYRECDEIVGEAMKYADDETLFIVLSDHGMNSFQRGLNVNTWLFENGFLALKDGANPGEGGDFFENVDWDKTKAYAIGLGCIYLNLKEREANGILNAEEAELARDGIVGGLTGLVDTDRNAVAVRSVVRREQVYSGPYLSEAPDLLLNFSEGYRVSWDTPLGGVPQGLFKDNHKKWSGDHVIDPALSSGVLFMNKKIRTDSPSLLDLAPTILNTFGVPKGAEMEGSDLLS